MNKTIKNYLNAIYAEFTISESEEKIRESIRELNSYTDAELSDLGISRISIEESVRGENSTEDQRFVA